MRGWDRLIGVLCGAALCLAIFAGAGKLAAADASAEAELDASPSTVDGRKISSIKPILVQVRLKAGSKELSGIVLSDFSNDGIVASVRGGDGADKVARLPANAEHVWTLELKPTNGAVFPPAALKLYVNASYFEGTDLQIARTSFATVTINAPTETATPVMAGVEIKGALGALSFERPAKAFVVVTNKYPSELTIVSVDARKQQFAEFEAVNKPPYPPLAFGETQVIEYDVKAPEQVVPGRYPVVVVVHLLGADGITGSVTASPDVDVGVLGESDLLSRLGAPSLLFLPGVLFLLSWQLLWSIRKNDAERQAYPLQPSTATFWLAGVVISLVTAVAYPYIMLWVLKSRRDYLVAYGLRDYIYVFGLAISASCALFLLWLFLKWLATHLHATWLALFTPKVGDKPLAILNKLSRHHAMASFIQAYAVGGNATELLLVLEPWEQKDTLWLAPPAQLILTSATNYQAAKLKEQIADGLITDACELATVVKQGVDDKWWTIEWMTVGQNNTVIMAPVNAWHPIQTRASLVR